MVKIVRSLLWKEWHEQRWKLAFGSVILMGLVSVGLQARLLPDRDILLLAIFVGSYLLPVFVAMGLVAAEQGEGSLHTLLALPLRPWIMLGVKLSVGVAACIAPLAASAALACLMAGGREVPVAGILAGHGAAAVIAMCVLVWTISFSIRQPTEARAGLMGLAVVLVLVLSGAWVGRLWRKPVDYLNPVLLVRLTETWHWKVAATTAERAMHFGTYFLVQVAMAALLFWLALLRLPRHVDSRI